jgi:hypothetical protein
MAIRLWCVFGAGVFLSGSVVYYSGSSHFAFLRLIRVITLLHQIITNTLKQLVMKALLFLPALALILASCSNSDSSSDPVADLSTQNNMVSQKNWIVNLYTDSGKDETSNYASFIFNFKSDGTFIAASSTETYTGSWSLAQPSATPDDSGNDATDDKFNKFTILVSGSKLMEKLSHKWLVEKITDTEIWLRDDNPASGEYLHFGK